MKLDSTIETARSKVSMQFSHVLKKDRISRTDASKEMLFF